MRGGGTGKDGWGSASGARGRQGAWKPEKVAGGRSDAWGRDSAPETAVDAALTERKGKSTNSSRHKGCLTPHTLCVGGCTSGMFEQGWVTI